MIRWLDQLKSTIREKNLFRERQPILVAVSGGLDSMVLLHILHAQGWKLTIAHYNHQLRGKQSKADEQLVRQTAKNLKLSAVIGRGDVKKFAARTGLSIEMAARQLRHDFLAQAAAKHKIKTIAMAHHADDQVELFFLRLFRGAGGEGLAGMKWKSPSPADPKIQLVRPLLNQTKADLQAYAKLHKIRFSEDATNASIDILRNRIRHKLIPHLEKKYQSALARTTLRLMDLTGEDAVHVNNTAEQWLKQKSRGAFAKLPVAVQRRVIQSQLHKLKQKVDFDLVESLRLKPNAPINLTAQSAIERDTTGHLHLLTLKSQIHNLKSVPLVLDNTGQHCFAQKKLSWKITARPGDKFQPQTNTEYFDATKIGPKIILRHWQPGDRFQPIGTHSPRKLQDLFTNLKVPQPERHERIIATTLTGEIFWVEGLRISERFKLDKETVRRLKWHWRGNPQSAVAARD